MFYRRRLPHWQPDEAILFITYRLAGSLPKSAIERLSEERRNLLREPRQPREEPRDRALRHSLRLFALLEEALHTTCRQVDSPRWLAEENVALLVRDALYFWDGQRYVLHRYVLMPNHVHLLFEPLPLDPDEVPEVGRPRRRWAVGKIMHGLKSFTSKEANRRLSRFGEFWQDEWYDHWIRNEAEYRRTVAYIDENPVAAGLCARPQDWPWSSAGEGRPILLDEQA